ncbi:DUF3999 family protein [Ideonella sp. DXS29W]|uniref:DUF3999 family protein n=1 Tax=Ideonella lacteola TaxID=2984193 RepID=A0ABU9BJS6_9BURK
MRCAWMMWMALAAVSASAGEAPLKLQGEGAYYTLRLPLGVRAQAKSADLSDLRVLNGAGDAVPYAWVDDEAATVATPNRQSVPLFKAPAAAGVASQPAPALQGGWIVDLRAVKGLVQELQLDITPEAHGIYPFMLEASDDLQRWRMLQPEAQLVALQHQGLRLERSSFELAGTDGGVSRAGYLRLRPIPGAEPLPLKGAHIVSLAHRTDLPDWQWSESLSPAECTETHCDYVLPRHLPLQRVEFELAQSNTLAQVQLLVQADDEPHPEAPRAHGHRVRDHLRGLRHKEAPVAPRQDESFWPLASGTVYALNLQGSAVRSTVMTVSGGLYRKLRVQPTGGMAQLGAVAPRLRVAGRAANLVFLARGPGPYRLAWAQTSPPVAMSLDQLMPGRRADDPLPQTTAELAPATVASTASPTPPAPSTASAPTADTAGSNHKLWLWAAMAGALLLMGFMAWTLLKPGAAPRGDPPTG